MNDHKILIAFVTSILLICLISCNTYVNIPLSNITKGAWSQVTTDNGTEAVKRHEAAFINVKDKMYLLGGRGMKPVSIYDPLNNTWKQGSTAPIELHHFQPVVYQGEIYIIGAMTGGYPGETPVSDIHIYNPTNDNWRIGGTISDERARGGAGVVIHDDHLYLVCGIKDGHRGDHKNWLDRYDLANKTWEILPDAPLARDHFQSVVTRGKIYSLAGRTTISSDNPFKHTIGTVDVYDIDSQTWSTLETELPTWRAGNTALVVDDEIIILGGESFTQELAHSEMEALNVITGKWRILPAIPVGRHGTGLINYKGTLYVASGCGNRGGSPEMNDLWKFEY